MEEEKIKEEKIKADKKTIKIRLSSILCVLLILIIAVLAYYMYNQKTNHDKEIKKMEDNNANLQRTIDDLQGKIILMEEENEKNNSISNNTVTNTTDETNEEMTDEEVDEIAKELFEKGSEKIRETVYSSYDQYELVIPSDEKVLKGKVYEKRNALYSDIELEYSEIFTGKALEVVLQERFTDSDGNLYITSRSDDTEWEISNVSVERVSEDDGEIEYKVTYNDVESDGSISDTITCKMKIKLVDDEYRILETDYCELM